MSICANCREGNQRRQLRMANETQCIIPYVTQKQCNTVRSNTLQLHNNQLSNRTTCRLIITSASLPIPSQTPHNLIAICFSMVVVLSNVILTTPSRAFSEHLMLCTAKLADKLLRKFCLVLFAPNAYKYCYMRLRRVHYSRVTEVLLNLLSLVYS